jgi:hydrogenase maturation protease
MKTLVLGIGNSLLGDEGIGPHVIGHLHRNHPKRDHVELLDGGTLSFSLAGFIEDADHLIVVDAAELQDAPGTVRTFVGEDMDRFLNRPGRRSVHEVGLTDLLTIALLNEHYPAKRALIGVQPKDIDWAEEPSAAVAAAIPGVCDTVNALIEEWHR